MQISRSSCEPSPSVFRQTRRWMFPKHNCMPGVFAGLTFNTVSSGRSYAISLADLPGSVSTRADKCRPCLAGAVTCGYAACRMPSTVTLLHRNRTRRWMAGTCWLRRVRGRRWWRSSPWARQNRAADRGHLKPIMGRQQPFRPRWSCSSPLFMYWLVRYRLRVNDPCPKGHVRVRSPRP